MKSFFDYYDLYSSTNQLRNVFVKAPSNKKCRFCGRVHPETSFNTIPHVIPELFGRNNIVSNFECDECNRKFQKFENDASTMILHNLSLLNIPTKRSVPVFQSIKSQGDYPTTMQRVQNDISINFGTNLSDFKYDKPKKTLTVWFRTKRFRPFFVYKTFLKLGMSLLKEEDLENNQHYFDFLNEEAPIDNGMQEWRVFRHKLKTKYHVKPNANLYRAKKTIIDEDAFPEYVLLLNFSNIIFQFFLPISTQNIKEHSKNNTLHLDLFPAFVLENMSEISQFEIKYFNLKVTDKVFYTDKVVLSYESLHTTQEAVHPNKPH